MSIIIVRVIGKKVKFIGGKGRAHRDIWFRKNCRPGKYIAIVSTMWKEGNVNVVKGASNDYNNFSFWIYAEQPTKVQRIKSKENLKKCEDYLYNGLKDYVSGDLPLTFTYRRDRLLSSRGLMAS